MSFVHRVQIELAMATNMNQIAVGVLVDLKCKHL